MSYLYQARSGIARSDATVSDDFSRVYAYLTINGVSRRLANIKDTRPTSITEQKDANGKSAFFAIRADRLVQYYSTAGFSSDAFEPTAFGADSDAFIPTVAQEVVIGIGSADNRFFGGHILKRNQVYFQKDENLIYECECGGYWWAFGQDLVSGTWPASAADVMVKAIVAYYAPWCLTAFVETGLASIPAMTFSGKTSLAEAVVAIAAVVGAAVWIDDYRRLHFRVTPETGYDPPTITDFSKLLNDTLRFTQDTSQAMTRVFCDGPTASVHTAIAAGTGPPQIDVDGDITATWAATGSVKVGKQMYSYQLLTYNAGPNTTSIFLGAPLGPAYPTWNFVDAIAVGDVAINEGWAYDAAAVAALAAAMGYGDGFRDGMADSPNPLTGAAALTNAIALRDQFKNGEVSTNYLTRAKKHHAGRNVTFALGGMAQFAYTLTIAGVTFSQLDYPDRLPLRTVTASNTYRTYIGQLASLATRGRFIAV